MKFGMWVGAAVTVVLAGAPGALAAQDWCDRGWGDRDEDRFCEEREVTLADRELIAVDGGRNGGIRVQGWDRNEIQLVARVWARDRDEDGARALVEEIEIVTDGREIRAEGPSTRRRQSWGVSFRLMVPHDSNLSLEAHNGGISIADVTGEIRFNTRNGGVSLEGVGGDVRGETRNGGLDVSLTGEHWQGRGLDVETRNGGLDIEVPEGYSADFETGTRNGGMSIDFPIMVQGRIGRTLETTLGDGGPPVRIKTTNGGVRIRRR